MGLVRISNLMEGIFAAITLIGISCLVPGSPLVLLYALMVVVGIAIACQNNINVPFHQLGLDMQLYGTAQETVQFFGLLGVTLTSSIFAMILLNARAFIQGLSTVFVVGGLMCLMITFIPILFIKNQEFERVAAKQTRLAVKTII